MAINILFVNPPFKAEYGKFSREARSPMITNSGVIYYPLWLLYAAGVSEKQGHDITFVDAPAKRLNDEETLKLISKDNKDYKLIVIDTSTPSIYSDVDFAVKLKETYKDAFVILVGTHPTALPEETLNINAKIDGIARGEFDYIVRDLADAIDQQRDLSTVKGLTFRNSNGDICKNPAMPPIENMNEIPFAAKLIKKYLNPKDYFFAASEYPEIQIFTGRGCMCRCYFCVYPQVMHGHNYRARSAENVVEEFEYIVNEMPDIKEIVIEDDTFTIDIPRVQKICKLLIEKGINKKIKWLCNARVNLDYETMVLMKKAGCKLLVAGMENGLQEMLNNMKKGTTVAQIEQYVKNAKKAKLLIHACYMVGTKGETRETMQNTLDFAIKLNTDTAQFYVLHPYPGTEAYNYAVEQGYLEDKKYEDYLKEDGTDNCVLHIDDISSDELVEFCNYARRKYYLRPRYILYKMRQSIFSKDEFVRNIKGFKNIAPRLFKRKGKAIK